MFFDNETANSIADPETYNRSNNEKGGVHVDHTSLPEEPTSGFADVCPNNIVQKLRLQTKSFAPEWGDSVSNMSDTKNSMI